MRKKVGKEISMISQMFKKKMHSRNNSFTSDSTTYSDCSKLKLKDRIFKKILLNTKPVTVINKSVVEQCEINIKELLNK